jgi:hypothetical protein
MARICRWREIFWRVSELPEKRFELVLPESSV